VIEQTVKPGVLDFVLFITM